MAHSPTNSVWRRCLVIAPFAFAIVALLSATADAQLLKAVRSEVRESKSDSADDNDDDGHYHSHSSSCDDDDDRDSILGEICLHIIISPFTAPRAILEDEYYCNHGLADRPYSNDLGMLSPTGEGGIWSFRFGAEYGTDFDDLERIGANLLIETDAVVGIDTEFNHFRENLDDGSHDELWLGDLNVTVRFAQGAYGNMRAGIGFNWMNDDYGTDYGFNFTYGGDFFPCDPVVLSAVMDIGTLGDASLFHFRSTAGLMIGSFEVYTGYDYYNIEGAELNGLVGGVRVWF